jgi:hypothetical protein
MMNERIRELAKKNGLDITIDGMGFGEGDIEGLAELIVLEMCTVLDKEQWNIGRDWICDDGTRIIPKVKEHFGVE